MDRNECYARLGQACFILNVRRHSCGNKFDGTIVICLIVILGLRVESFTK